DMQRATPPIVLARFLSIPIEEVQAFIDQFAGQPTWADALSAFGASGPPTGDWEQNRRAADEAAHARPLLALVPTIWSPRRASPVAESSPRNSRTLIAWSRLRPSGSASGA